MPEDTENLFIGEIMERLGYGPMGLPATVDQLREIVKTNWNRATERERERCAKIADQEDELDGVDRDWHSACKTIAAAIRSGK